MTSSQVAGCSFLVATSLVVGYWAGATVARHRSGPPRTPTPPENTGTSIKTEHISSGSDSEDSDDHGISSLRLEKTDECKLVNISPFVGTKDIHGEHRFWSFGRTSECPLEKSLPSKRRLFSVSRMSDSCSSKMLVSGLPAMPSAFPSFTMNIGTRLWHATRVY